MPNFPESAYSDRRAWWVDSYEPTVYEVYGPPWISYVVYPQED